MLESSPRAVLGSIAGIEVCRRGSGCMNGCVSHQVPGKQDSSMAASGRGWSQVTGLYQDLQLVQSWRAYLHGHVNLQKSGLTGPKANQVQGHFMISTGAYGRSPTGSLG